MDNQKHKCEKACSEAPTEHKFIADHGEYNDIAEIECLNCHYHQKIPRSEWLSKQVIDWVRPSKAHLTQYPRIEPHTGEVVKSREHEREVMRAMGLHEAKHGIDERYNDEACDTLRSRRLEHEKRKRQMEEKRRAMGRAPARR